MKSLTYKETAFLMNISDDAAINIFIRYLKPDQIERMHSVDGDYKPQERKQIIKELKHSLKGEKLEIYILTRHFGIDVQLLVDSINDRFFKSKECIDYLISYFKKKWVPNKKTNFYPIDMIAPPEVVSFMNDESKRRLHEWFSGRYLWGPENHKIECKLKIK